MQQRLLAAAVTAFSALVFTATAGAATTLGVTATPVGAATSTCNGAAIGQRTDDPTTPYLIPAGGGTITQWQTDTAGDTAGSSVTFAVVRPDGTTGYTVVAADTETLPNPLPINNVASFTLAKPIPVAPGDSLALYSASTDVCYFNGGSIPTTDTLFAAAITSAPTTAGTLTISGPLSPGGYTLNVAATLLTQEDAGVQTATFPSTTDVSSAALLQSVVTNYGPETTPITFVDRVPAGLRIRSASAGMGSCAVSGQTVTCTITGLPVSDSTTVGVLVSPSKAGKYANTVSVSVAAVVTDPRAANNTASRTLVVTNLPQRCIVPPPRKAVLRTARSVLKGLGCRVRVVHQHSLIHRELVISVRGGVRTYAYRHRVTLVVSSGPKRRS